MGGGGGTDGIWPYYEVVQNGLYFGLSPNNRIVCRSAINQDRSGCLDIWIQGSRCRLGLYTFLSNDIDYFAELSMSNE
jgi:hypothetical protein